MSLLNQRYLKVIKIGQGSYGDVYAAQDKLYKKSPNDTMDIEQDPSNKLNLVALKKLKSCNKEGVHFSTIREIKILKEANHPNIIKLLDTFVEKESIYLVLEYCLTDLNKILHAKINLTLNDIKTIMFQIIQGVNHLHKMFILHRDLSTSNLLFNQDGFLKISDFGLARYHGSPNKLLTRNIVTRYYRPPEILYGSQGYSYGVDMWSIGCIFGELFYGKPLFPGETDIDQLSKIFFLRGNPTEENWPGCTSLPLFIGFEDTTATPIQKWIPNIPDNAAALIEQLLQLDPNKRMTCENLLKDEFFKDVQLPNQSEMINYLKDQNQIKQQEMFQMIQKKE